jgi:putative chitinase
LSSDQRQVYGVAQPGWCHLPDADQFDKITRRINGGQNGAVDRQALYAWALKVLA